MWCRDVFEGHWQDKLSECHPQLVFAKPGVERQDSVLSGLRVSRAHSLAFRCLSRIEASWPTVLLPACHGCNSSHVSSQAECCTLPVLPKAILCQLAYFVQLESSFWQAASLHLCLLEM